VGVNNPVVVAGDDELLFCYMKKAEGVVVVGGFHKADEDQLRRPVINLFTRFSSPLCIIIDTKGPAARTVLIIELPFFRHSEWLPQHFQCYLPIYIPRRACNSTTGFIP
jgi:hypothetical protein